jgi:hypothetical protein
MNIFWLDEDPYTCAQYHNNAHCIKQILEYAQILSTAHRVLDGSVVSVPGKSGKPRKHLQLRDPRQDSILYKPTHVNHPSTVWARQSKANYVTLHTLFMHLLSEYEIRYGREHKTKKLSVWLSVPPKNIPDVGRTQLPLCMPDQYKVFGNPVESYRNYYRTGKSHIAKWKHRQIPEWYK